MNAEQYAKLHAGFEHARKLSPVEQANYLNDLETTEPSLADEIRGLLKEDDRTSDAFAESRLGAHLETQASNLESKVMPANAPIPEVIGNYRIEGVLGRGGMGTVYRARQASPDREVALKVMHPTLSDRALWRFEFEGRLLARLQHPAIAQVYEIGRHETDFGTQPFIVMELVEGQDIATFVQQRDLADEQRLELIARLCDGIQFAHQQRVVHRDLKPGNVIVSSNGRPHILDFGVARGGDEESSERLTEQRTQAGEIVGTLAYMSPEQAAGDPDAVGVEADIYALGVMGYELLSGKLPLDLDTRKLGTSIRRLQEEQPTTLSGLNSRWRGDVSTIFQKALSKEPQRRYSSAAAFAGDIRRYLAHEPILARPATGWYTFTRFAYRNKLLAGSLVFIVLLILSSLAAITRYSVIATGERRLAESRLEEADAIASFHEEMLAASRSLVGGEEITVAEVIDVTADEIDDWFPEPSLAKARMLHTIGTTYRAVMRFEQSEHFLLRGFQMRTDLLGANHSDTVESETELGSIYWQLNRRELAEKYLRGAVESTRALWGKDSPETIARTINLGVFLDDDPLLYGDAEALYRDLLETMEASEEGLETINGVSTLNNLAVLLRRQGRLDEALEYMQLGNQICVEVFGLNNNKTIVNFVNLAGTLMGLDRNEEALVALEAAYQPTLDVHGKEHVGYGMLLYRKAGALAALHRVEEAKPLYVESLECLEGVYGQNHYRPLTMRSSYAAFLMDTGSPEEGLEIIQQIRAVWPQSDDPDPLNEARFMQVEANAHLALNRWDSALQLVQSSYELHIELRGEDDPATINALAMLDLVRAGPPEQEGSAGVASSAAPPE